MESEYLRIAIQYYVAGRSAAFGGFMPVAGNLFHHAIEMLLKYSLLAHCSADQLRNKFRHHLKRLWKEFKSETGGTAFSQYDQIIAKLDKMEDLRYPKKGYAFSSSSYIGTKLEPNRGTPHPQERPTRSWRLLPR